MAGPGHGTRAVVVAMLASAAVAAATFVGSSLTASGATLAAGLLSAAAAGTHLLLLLAGARAARKAPDEDPSGSGRERWFWAFVVGVVLFVLGCVVAVVEGLDRLDRPEVLADPEVAVGILGAGLLVLAVALRIAVVDAKQAKGDATYRQFLRSATLPALPVVLLGTLGATFGLALALAAVVTADATEDPAWDAYGALAVGGLLGASALVLAAEMKRLLLGTAAGRRQREAIRAAIEIEPGVQRILHMRTDHIGPDELLVCAKVEFDHRFTFPEVAEAVDRVERNLRTNVAEARVVYLEPDVAPEHRSAPAVTPHVPTSEVPPEIKARMEAEERAARWGPALPPVR